MKKISAMLLFCFIAATLSFADEITFTAVNLSHSTFSADDVALMFGNAINVLVTDNTTGKSIMLLSVQSGNTGPATDFVPGPPLIADYSAAGANSVLIASTGTTYLSGDMQDSGRLEADYPDKAGAFLSRFHVDFVSPTILLELGTSTHFAPEGSVSLTVAETSFTDGILNATLGGSQITIETQPPVPEPTTVLFWLGGTLIAGSYWSRQQKRGG